MPNIRIPTPLRAYAGGQSQVDVAGNNVGAGPERSDAATIPNCASICLTATSCAASSISTSTRKIFAISKGRKRRCRTAIRC